jgi:hypothetical protein
MISKTFRIALAIILASFALSSAAWATCSNASLSGTYGFLHNGTDSNGTPFTAAVSQLTFDSATGTFTGETTASHDGEIVTDLPLTGTYKVSTNCTGKGTPQGGSPFSIVVTPTGFLALHLFAEGFAVSQGSPTCTTAGVKGSFGFETTGVFLDAATEAVAFIGELKLTVNRSGEGVISGHLSASEDGTFQTFAEEPVTGSYRVGRNCRGRATITPKGVSEMHFDLVVVDGGNEMLAIETDTGTVVSGTLVKGN